MLYPHLVRIGSVVDPDRDLFYPDRIGSGIILPDPDSYLTFLKRKSV